MSQELFTNNWLDLNKGEREKRVQALTTGAPYYVVYVDDDPLLLEIMEEKIQEMGLKPVCLASPNDVLTFLKDNRSRVVLVISDIKMPEMNGFELRKLLLPEFADIPFMVLSGHIDKDMAIKAMDLKIAKFLDKPLKDSSLIEAFYDHVNNRLKSLVEERELLQQFLEDALQLVDTAEEMMIEMDDGNAKDTLNKIFGLIHTIKGSSGFFYPKTLHNFSHKLEDFLKQTESSSQLLQGENLVKRSQVILKAFDFLKVLIGEFKTEQHKAYANEVMEGMLSVSLGAETAPDEQGKVASKEVKAGERKPELKVSLDLLDNFMQITGEMTVIRNMINKVVKNVEKNYPGDRDVQSLSELLEEMHHINSSVQASISDIRKVNFKGILKPIHRLVRDTAQKLGKDVDFKTEGEELRIDTSLGELLSQSLVHLVRNSLDHGLETKVDREASGKPAKGCIKISAEIKGENILLQIEDDGRGIDAQKIKAKIIEKNLMSQKEASLLSESELLMQVFAPGFSTADQVSDISGRGVGMSFVKESIEARGGHIDLKTKIGSGTVFSLFIPLPKSVLILNSLFVKIKNETYGVPQDTISRVIKVTQDNYSKWIKEAPGGGFSLLLENHALLPLYSLSYLLGELNREAAYQEISQFSECLNVLVMESKKFGHFALLVDEVLDVEDAVVKPLVPALKNLSLFLGGTFLPDAQVGLILDVDGLAQKLDLKKRQSSGNADRDSVEKLENQVLAFKLTGDNLFAIPEKVVFRIEVMAARHLSFNNNQILMPYRDQKLLHVLPLAFWLNPEKELVRVQTLNALSEEMSLIVFAWHDQFVGLIVEEVLDILPYHEKDLKELLSPHTFIASHLMINRSIYSLLSFEALIEKAQEVTNNQDFLAKYKSYVERLQILQQANLRGAPLLQAG